LREESPTHDSQESWTAGEHQEPNLSAATRSGREVVRSELQHAADVVLDVITHVCPGCGYMPGPPDTRSSFRVEIARIDAREAGWLTVGQITDLSTVCPSCGQFYSALHRVIPIECAEFACPKCHRSESLDYRVERIELVDERYVFVASIECTKCHHRSLLRRLLDQLDRITKVKVAVDGVEFERSGH